MITFNPFEARVAYSMIRAAKNIKPSQEDYDPIEKFFYLWIAFNNIYQVITDYNGKSPQLKKLPDGSVETKIEGKLTMPKVEWASEGDQLNFALKEFDAGLKERIIKHESTIFFVYRVPRWHGKPIEYDSRGQKLNGVLKVARTVSKDDPVWSAIDTEVYERYINGKIVSPEEVNFLVEQIVNVLYSVRNNLFHSAKRVDDSNDVEVVDKAIPLLLLIVSAFTR